MGSQAAHVRKREYSMPTDSFGRLAHQAIRNRVFETVRSDV
jgi:hypothetical protein